MKSLKVTILTEIEIAIQDSRSFECDDLEEAVHSVRRRCKRIRAYIDLLPRSLTKQSRRAGRYVRLAALSLSELRDAQVMDRTRHELHQRLIENGVEESAIEVPQCSSQEELNRSAQCLTSVQNQMALATRLLKKAKRILSRILKRQLENSLILRLRKTYRGGRLATERAIRQGCPENFHKLRKMTKQFYFQCQFIASTFDGKLEVEIDQARTLADKLGDGLDLAMLASNLASTGQKPIDAKLSATISESATRMNTLFNDSALLACRVFFDSPKKFYRIVTMLVG